MASETNPFEPPASKDLPRDTRRKWAWVFPLLFAIAAGVFASIVGFFVVFHTLFIVLAGFQDDFTFATNYGSLTAAIVGPLLGLWFGFSTFRAHKR